MNYQSENRKVVLSAPNNNRQLTFQFKVKVVRVLYAPQLVRIYAGYGTSEPISVAQPGDRYDIIVPGGYDTITIGWDLEPPLPNAPYAQPEFLISSEALGEFGGQSVIPSLAQYDSLGNIRLTPPWGSASSLVNRTASAGLVYLANPSTDPAYVQFTQPVRVSFDKSPTYSVSLRAGSAPFWSTVAIGANARAALGTIWNDPATATYIDLLKAESVVLDTTAASEIALDLYRVTNAPTVGVSRTPIRHDTADPASIADARLTPTQTLPAIATAVYFAGYKLGITGAVPVTNPGPPAEWQTLYDRSNDPSERRMRAAPGEGWCIAGLCENATTIRFGVRFIWEENAT